jgi:hypothetical protein
LAAFGGLHVGRCGGGEECSKSDIEFRLLDRPDRMVQDWESLLNVALIGVGEANCRHEGLYVDNVGRVFGESWVHPAFYIHGEVFVTAIENVLLGRRVRPLLRPNEDSVRLYGEEYTRSDPRIYHFGR